jgi:hypothetical protein
LAASCRYWSFTSGIQTPLKSGKAAIAAHSFSRTGDAPVSCAVEVLATIYNGRGGETKQADHPRGLS